MSRSEAARGAAACHLILGEDSYLAEEALEEILQRTVGAERDEGVRVFYGDESRWEEILAAARTGSLFVARRVIVVRRADELRYEREGRATARASLAGEEEPDTPAAATAKGRAKSEADAVCRYLDSPSPDATLVLLAAKPDRRRNPWKRLSAEAEVHSAEPKKGAALRGYVEEQLRRRGLGLDAQALKDLIDGVGQNLRRLMGELEKLQAWNADGKGPLTADDVHAVLGRGLARPLYLLADAVAARDLSGGLAKLEELLEGGEEGLRILSTIHRSLRQVRTAGALLAARVPRAEVGARLLPPHMQFKLDALLAAARRWPEADLRRALRATDRADRAVKTGADVSTALVLTLVEACGGGAATSSSRGR